MRRLNGILEIPTFVKWAGGKSQLLKQFSTLFPEDIKEYHEPFVGSGAVFFYLKRNNPKLKAYLSDVNEELITTFMIIRDKVEKLIKLLKKHKGNHSKEYYYEVRSLDPKDLNNVEVAARFIYLNKTCFNGLYRVNSKGQFNVPIGSYKNPGILKEDILREASKLLKGTIIKIKSFEEVLKNAKDDSFIYFDPPYHPLSKTSKFTQYTKNNFLEAEQKQLAEVFEKLNKKRCKIMLSNSDHKFIEHLYDDFKIEHVFAKRLISCDAKKRGLITELVIRNY